MTNKLTLTEQEELFAKDCKLINLKYEYNGLPEMKDGRLLRNYL